MRTVIFDLDGTLADTSGDLIASANVALAGGGVPVLLDPEGDRLTAFHGGKAMLRLGLARAGRAGDEAAVEALYPALLAAYAADIDRHTRLYPGALEAVEVLAASGYALGICTNKPAALAETLLARLGVRGLFGSMVGADSLPFRKPDPAPYRAAVEAAGGVLAHSLLVGDTEIDRATARAAGVPCVLVSFGPEGAGVARMAPEALLERYEDLPGLVTRLIG